MPFLWVALALVAVEAAALPLLGGGSLVQSAGLAANAARRSSGNVTGPHWAVKCRLLMLLGTAAAAALLALRGHRAIPQLCGCGLGLLASQLHSALACPPA